MFIIACLSGFAVAQTASQRGSLDPAFNRVPFDQWLTTGGQARLRWSIRVARPELSFHQRLLTRVEIQVDGRDIAARRGTGEFVYFIQIESADGSRYQRHEAINLGKIDESVKGSNLEYVQPAFVTPGDYQIAVAVFDSATGEHSVKQEKLHVLPPKSDPFPDSGRDLPPVEMIVPGQMPESWFLPDVKGLVRLVSGRSAPLRIDVIVNVAPIVQVPGSRRTQGGNLDAILPTMKVLAQGGGDRTSVGAELLDLSRRRVVFKQTDVHELDWPRLKDSLKEANDGTIDVKTLEGRHQDAAFFVSEVRKIVDVPPNEGASHILIVLSNPTMFESGKDLEPIHLEYPPHCRAFYIRYHAQVAPVGPIPVFSGRQPRGRGPIGGSPRRNVSDYSSDQLEKALKPLNPSVFDVESPADLRKALASILLN